MTIMGTLIMRATMLMIEAMMLIMTCSSHGRYFKQQEIILWRKGEKKTRVIQSPSATMMTAVDPPPMVTPSALPGICLFVVICLSASLSLPVCLSASLSLQVCLSATICQ